MTTLLLGLALAAGGSDTVGGQPEVIGAHSYNADWRAGYAAGMDAAEQAQGRRPLLIGVGAGTAVAGTGVFFCGLGGAPCVALAPLVPALGMWRVAPMPDKGPWENAGVDYQNGYIVGYQERNRQRQARAAALGGVVGAAVGTGVGIGALFLVDDALN